VVVGLSASLRREVVHPAVAAVVVHPAVAMAMAATVAAVMVMVVVATELVTRAGGAFRGRGTVGASQLEGTMATVVAVAAVVVVVEEENIIAMW
jgi:hypothetical protein